MAHARGVRAEVRAGDQDIQTITTWLATHGLHVDRVAKGGGIIEFSGTAAQVKETFHTEIHKYDVHGEEHWANSSDPQIPTALAPVVAGIVSLHNFPRHPLHHVLGAFSKSSDTDLYKRVSSPLQPTPLITGGVNCGLQGGPCYGVGPYDFAKIYNLLPLWDATPAVDGTGQTIAIVGQSDIYPSDVSDFHQIFGLPAPKLNIIYNGENPGKLPSQGDEAESDLDVEWSSAIAKGATIDFVVSASTNTTAGTDLSAEYIIDNNLAPVMSESYGACELELGTAGNQFFNQMWQQAAAEGITVFVSTGDSGSAVCDDKISPVATFGLSVSGISSTPYNVAVGGTDFDDLQNASTYWNSTSDPTTKLSAKSYVPERTWNDTCTNSEFLSFTGDSNAESACNNSSSHFYPGYLVPIGASGGASNCTISSNQSVATCSGGYTKPSWQSGPGVPNDGKRDVPDVSLFAAAGLNASFYVICELDIYGGCGGSAFNVVGIGGTSASAPAFAAIMALVNQKTQSRQGLANYMLYPLAAQAGSSCASSGTPASSCTFYDVTAGTIAMPCVTGSPNCVTNTSGHANGVLSGYDAMAGYDLATGLGSVNVENLVNNWTTVSFQPTVATLSLSPTAQITHGSPVRLNITVAPKTGTGTPTGQVSLVTSTNRDAGTYSLVNGSFSGTTTLLPGGSYSVTAHYAGDGVYAASDSSGVPVAVNSESSVTTLQAFTLDQQGNATPFTTDAYGADIIYLRVTVAGQSAQGFPTGSVNVTQTLNGVTTNLPGNPYSLNSDGYTMIPLPGYNYQAYAPGTYSFVAKYAGDGSFKAGTSQPIGFSVTKAQTTSATSIVECNTQPAPCVLSPSQSVTIFGTVSAHGAAITNLPTGTMTFLVNGTPLAPPQPVDTGIVPPVASVNIALPAGADNITVQYSGDSDYLSSASPATLADVGQTFTINANPTVISVAAPGFSGSTTLTFTPQSGLTGTTTLTTAMCSNLPPKSSCRFNPGTVTFTSSTTSVPVTLTIDTTSSSGVVGANRPFTLGRWLSNGIAAVFVMGICLVQFRGRRERCSLLALVAFAVLLCSVGCGGGGGGGGAGGGGAGGGGGGGGNSGTPPGNYIGVTVTVTINGVTQSINTLSVNVQ